MAELGAERQIQTTSIVVPVLRDGRGVVRLSRPMGARLRHKYRPSRIRRRVRRRG